MKNCCRGQEVVDFQAPREGAWLNVNSEPLSLAPQQMRDKSRNDCQPLVLARKCVCQTPPPCAGAVSKGISPKGGAFSPPYGVSPTGWPVSLCWRPRWTESVFCTLRLPLKLSHPFCYVGKWGVKVATLHRESHGLSCCLSELCHPWRLGKFSPRGGHLPSVIAGKEQHREVKWFFWGPCRGWQQIPHWQLFPHHLLLLLTSANIPVCVVPQKAKMPKDVCWFLTGDGIFDLPQHFWHLVSWLVLHVWPCICEAALKDLALESCQSAHGSMILSPLLARLQPGVAHASSGPCTLCQMIPGIAHLRSVLTPYSLRACCMAKGCKQNSWPAQNLCGGYICSALRWPDVGLVPFSLAKKPGRMKVSQLVLFRNFLGRNLGWAKPHSPPSELLGASRRKRGSLRYHRSDSLQPPGLNPRACSCSVGHGRLQETPQPQAGTRLGLDWTRCWDDKHTQCFTLSFLPRLVVTVVAMFLAKCGGLRELSSSPSSCSRAGGRMCFS